MRNIEMTNHKTKGILLVLFSTLMYGSYGVWSRLLGPHFPNFYQGYVKALLISVPLVIFLILREGLPRIDRRDLKWFVVYLAFTSATQAPLYYAYNHMDIGGATLLFYVTCLITMYLIGYYFLDERITVIKLFSFALGCAGLYTVFSFSISRFSLLAAGMAILNGIATGGEVAFSKKLSERYSAIFLTAISWLIIAVTSLPISLILGEQQIIPAFNTQWLILIGYSVVSLLGFWSVIYGLRYLEASIGGLIGMLEIIFGIALGIFLFDEELTLKIFIGATLILAAAAMASIRAPKNPDDKL
jgi:drug/metabolite transporter (DMT)-like permease